jgi:hypothetical protein
VHAEKGVGEIGRIRPRNIREEQNMKWSSYAISALALAAPFLVSAPVQAQQPQHPNILVIMGDDIGQSDISAYTFGLMGYHTPNIDRIVANEGMKFTDYYPEQSCTAGRSSFIDQIIEQLVKPTTD